MTREDIINLARESADQSPREDWNTNAWVFGEEALERFFHAAYAAGAADERELCAQVCEQRTAYSMPIPCPDGIEGCCVAHFVPRSRAKTSQECAEEIRARGEK